MYVGLKYYIIRGTCGGWFERDKAGWQRWDETAWHKLVAVAQSWHFKEHILQCEVSFWTEDIEVEVFGDPLLAVVACVHPGTLHYAVLENAQSCHSFILLFDFTLCPKSTKAYLDEDASHNWLLTVNSWKPPRKIPRRAKRILVNLSDHPSSILLCHTPRCHRFQSPS